MKMNLSGFLFIIFNLKALVILINASAGDRSYYYIKCTQNCFESHCSLQKNIEHGSQKKSAKSKFELNQSVYLKYLGWDCFDECKYECMWHTVDYFTEIEKRTVPQFYGKWPFIRIYGEFIQVYKNFRINLIDF